MGGSFILDPARAVGLWDIVKIARAKRVSNSLQRWKLTFVSAIQIMPFGWSMMSGTGLLLLGITGNCLVVFYIAVAVLHRFFFLWWTVAGSQGMPGVLWILQMLLDTHLPFDVGWHFSKRNCLQCKGTSLAWFLIILSIFVEELLL